MSSVVKTSEEVELMRGAGKVLAGCLDTLKRAAKPGVNGERLDKMAEEYIKDHGAIPAFKGYGPEKNPFPASICFSRNHEIVHGVPTKKSVIKDGDVVTIDCGLSLNGWFADAARLFGVGEVSAQNIQMIVHTEEALEAGIRACIEGNRLGDVCNAIQREIVRSPFFNVYQFCGHAIGTQMHESPQVPNFGRPGTGIRLKPGMVFCLEPMLRKHRETELGILEDGWTVISKDSSITTHIEHMVLVTDGQPEILT